MNSQEPLSQPERVTSLWSYALPNGPIETLESWPDGRLLATINGDTYWLFSDGRSERVVTSESGVRDGRQLMHGAE